MDLCDFIRGRFEVGTFVWQSYAQFTEENRDPEQTRKLFDKYKPTHVIHLAAMGTIKCPFVVSGAEMIVIIVQSAVFSRT